MRNPLHLVLTGPPRVGKTTLVTKICNLLKSEPQVSLHGFYTTELRNASGSSRIGFQVVTIDGQTGTLSNINSTSSKRVGQYGVELEEFESVALPQFKAVQEQSTTPAKMTSGPIRVLIIDEIGKMELFSTKFREAVNTVFNLTDLVILATIPVQGRGKPIEFVENIRTGSDTQLITVNFNNRNGLVDEIFNRIRNYKQ